MDKLKVSLEFPGCGVSGISAASIQNQGAREYQEDCCGFSVSPESLESPGELARSFCAVVADGMGGLAAGAFVSDYTVKRLLESNIGDSAESGGSSVPEQFLSAVQRISGEVAAGGSQGGSTLAAVVCVPEGAYFCSVGDSRIYLLRRGILTQLTEDEDYFNILLDNVISGQITYEQAENDLDKDSLSQFIGLGLPLAADRNLIPLLPEPGDRLLICSDGVYNALSHEEILQSMTLSAPAAVEDLTGRILAKGYTNQDNFTAVALEFLPGEPSEAPADKMSAKAGDDAHCMCDFSSYTNPGSEQRNEDSLYAGNGIFAVADGLGGHNDGEKASAAAIKYFSENAVGSFKPEEINRLLEGANTAVRNIGGGYSTIAAGFAADGVFSFGNVGDSRVYYLRGGRIIAHTKDHSVCQAEVELGQINPEQIRFSEDRSRLLKALGSEERLDLGQSYEPISIQPGDSFIVCSDGFWEYVHEHEMEADRLKSTSSAEWLRHMIKRRLLKCGGGDNFTAVCGIFTDRTDRTDRSDLPNLLEPAREISKKKRRFSIKLLLAAGIAAAGLCALAGTLAVMLTNN